MTRRVLVTGASGFIGRQVIASLGDHDVEIFAVGRTTNLSAKASSNVVTVKFDLLDQPSYGRLIEDIRPDLVLHVAWNVEHGRFWDSLDNLAWVSSTLELARACCNTSVRRFVSVGTCYEYDWPKDSLCIENKTPYKVHSLYDRAKATTRDLLSDALAKSHIEFAWARLFFIYGPHEAQQRLVASVITSLLSGRSAECSRGLSYRDYMDVRDVGRALAALALGSVVGDVNISSGVGYRVSEIVEIIGRLCGLPGSIRFGALADREEPPFIVGCNKRLGQEVGFCSRFNLEAGLKNAIEFWQERFMLSS